MKTVLMAVISLYSLFVVTTAYAANGRVVIDTGDNATYSKSVIPAAGGTPVVISTYSYTRNLLTCQNIGTTQIYVGDYAGIGNASTGTYVIGPSTAGPSAIWQTYTKEQVWAIANPGGSTIHCVEER